MGGFLYGAFGPSVYIALSAVGLYHRLSLVLLNRHHLIVSLNLYSSISSTSQFFFLVNHVLFNAMYVFGKTTNE